MSLCEFVLTPQTTLKIFDSPTPQGIVTNYTFNEYNWCPSQS